MTSLKGPIEIRGFSTYQRLAQPAFQGRAVEVAASTAVLEPLEANVKVSTAALSRHTCTSPSQASRRRPRSPRGGILS